ncbi:MAG TPA: hypothetical protein VFN96_04790 [Gemmatimonadales bacterium]|nr:hypothetical protein [Gemmatimonadales bacterium]
MSRLRRWLDAGVLRLRATHHRIRDFPVLVDNSRPDISTAAVLERLGDALDLIDRYTPHYGRHLRRDFAGILVQRYPCRGAYFPESRLCLVELTFTVHPDISVAQIAATILHEGMHARLHALGFPLEMADRARQERFCRRAEIELGRLAPGGAAVLERALASLELSDREVAPDIDWRLAARRVEEADRRNREV